MNCHEYDALLARDLEGELSPEERRSADAHLLDCERCSALRTELLGIAAAARDLPLMSPSRDLWDGIAARIDSPVVALDATTRRNAFRRPAVWMSAAAAALIVATAGATFLITRATLGGSPSQVATAQPDRPGQVASQPSETSAVLVADRSTTPADAAFDREVIQLRALLEQRRPDLDSSTVALLEHNLRIIDQAIAQSRAALAQDPSSALLSRQLHSALGRKVQVLRTAALLPLGTD
jgi:hypothetical protein